MNRNMTRNTERVTNSCAEYEKMQGKIQWLTEQLILEKKKLFGTSFEQLDQMELDQFAHLLPEEGAFALCVVLKW